MQSSHTSFVPELDLNPPVSWSKPASALGLSDPLKHLPPSQQVQRLQQQIQQHRQLQHYTSLHGHEKNRKSSGNSNGGMESGLNNNSGFSPTDRNMTMADNHFDRTKNSHHRHSMHFGAAASEFGYVQHINIQNHNDEDSNMSGDDQEEDGDGEHNTDSSSVSSTARGMDIKATGNTTAGYHPSSYDHYRGSPGNPQLSRGFTALHGFTPIISPGPTNSPPHLPPFSPGSESFTSDNSSGFASSIPVHHQHQQQSGSSYSSGTVESSLSSLAALSVMSTGTSGSPLFRRSLSSGYPNQAQETMSGIYQDQGQPSSSSSGSFDIGPRNNSNTTIDSIQTFTSVLGQQLQREQQQQQQQQPQQQPQQQQQQQDHSLYQQRALSAPTLSVSLPAPSTFQQYREQSLQQQKQNHQQEQQNQQQEHQPKPQEQQHPNVPQPPSRSKSQPLIPPPRRSIPARSPQTTAPRKYHGRQARQVPIITNVVKEVVTPTRRMAHILSEQKRREKINGGFDELKSVIPECADNTDSKATILRKAVDYICLLEDEIRKYVDLYGQDRDGQVREFRDQERRDD